MKPPRLLSSQEVADAAGCHIRRVQQLRGALQAAGIVPTVERVGMVEAYRWPPEAVAWIQQYRAALRRVRKDA